MKWAKCNVGAEKETDYGYYFQWGSITPNTKTECNWKHAPFNGGNTSYSADAFNLVKDTACPNDVLAKEYDAASQIMGGDWRMPTEADLRELINNTTNEWMSNYNGSGVKGRKFTSKTNGNSIFIPAAGYYDDGSMYSVGNNGNVWSSSLDASYYSSAWFLSCNSDRYQLSLNDRYYGRSVRGVRK